MTQSLEKFSSIEKQAFSHKIQMLKESVYPKKRKTALKSNSLKTLNVPKNMPGSAKVAHTEQQEINSPRENPEVLEPVDRKKMPRNKNLLFQCSKSASAQLNAPLTGRSWLPTKSNSNLLRINRIKNKQSEACRKIMCESPQQRVQRKYQPRDTQSLLRKNSLFLLNFIKLKQKKGSKVVQKDSIPFVLGKMHKNNIPFEEVKTSRQQREKKFIQNLKHLKEEKYVRKLQKNEQHTLLPQTW